MDILFVEWNTKKFTSNHSTFINYYEIIQNNVLKFILRVLHFHPHDDHDDDQINRLIRLIVYGSFIS